MTCMVESQLKYDYLYLSGNAGIGEDFAIGILANETGRSIVQVDVCGQSETNN